MNVRLITRFNTPTLPSIQPNPVTLPYPLAPTIPIQQAAVRLSDGYSNSKFLAGQSKTPLNSFSSWGEDIQINFSEASFSGFSEVFSIFVAVVILKFPHYDQGSQLFWSWFSVLGCCDKFISFRRLHWVVGRLKGWLGWTERRHNGQPL